MVKLERALHSCTRRNAPRNCPKDFRKRRLFFEPPNSFSNALGERFGASGRLFYGGMFYELAIDGIRKKRGRILFEILLQMRTGDNRVKISKMKTNSEIAPRSEYGLPAPEDRGYGIFPIAIELSKFVAKENDISRITIIPAGGCPSGYSALRSYYSGYGFRHDVLCREFLDFRELVLELPK
ncbi:MAG: hypothetical protein ACLFUZ_04695 [Candidatus Micrarchaeia archaeon]